MKWTIGDIHGNYLTLLELIKKVKNKDPKAEFYFTGDFCDRGPRSAEVIKYIIEGIKSKEFKAVKGNHEEMFYDFFECSSGFIQNGGEQTIDSYMNFYSNLSKDEVFFKMEEDARFLNSLPLYIVEDELIISHSFCIEEVHEKGIENINSIRDEIFNWNRLLPKENIQTNYFNITGHNITNYFRKHKLKGFNKKTEVIICENYACIDTGAFITEGHNLDYGGVLTALSYPGLEVLQQQNIDQGAKNV